MLMWTDWLAAYLQRSTRTALILIAVNLLPLLLVSIGQWDLQQVMLLYWLENGVIGIYNVIKIISAQREPLPARLFSAVFFSVHYGMFFVVHGLFLMTMLKLPVEMSNVMSLWTALPSGISPMLLVLLLSHGYSTVWHYFLEGEYQTVNAKKLFMRPYGRVVVLHITILGAGFAAQAMHEPRVLLVGLILLKTAIDVVLHVRSHVRDEPQALQAS